MAPKITGKKAASKIKATKNGKKFARVSKKKRLGRPPKANKDAAPTPKKALRRKAPGVVTPSAATLSWATALSDVNSVTCMLTKVMANPLDNIAGLSEEKLGIIKGACDIMNAIVQVSTKTLKKSQTLQNPVPDGDFDALEDNVAANQDLEAELVEDRDQAMAEIGA